jgi:hypothetical protein
VHGKKKRNVEQGNVVSWGFVLWLEGEGEWGEACLGLASNLTKHLPLDLASTGFPDLSHFPIVSRTLCFFFFLLSTIPHA